MRIRLPIPRRLHARALLVLLAALSVGSGCSSSSGGGSSTSAPASEATVDPDRQAETDPQPPPEGAPRPEAEPASPTTCEERLAEVETARARALSTHAACTFDNECVVAPFVTACGTHPCLAIHPAGLEPFQAEVARIDRELCAPFVAAGCTPSHVECARGSARCVDGHCAHLDGDAPLRDTPIPPENARDRADAPPPRPPVGDADDRARRLFAAIVHDDPSRAADFFFPREAFAKVKAMTDADAYWQRLFARYAADIHALHRTTPDLDAARYDHLEIVRRGGFMRPGEEGNALPYHAARHNVLHYRVGDEARALEVRVLITWGERWYVTHLSEFH